MGIFPATAPGVVRPEDSPDLHARWRRSVRSLYIAYVAVPIAMALTTVVGAARLSDDVELVSVSSCAILGLIPIVLAIAGIRTKFQGEPLVWAILAPIAVLAQWGLGYLISMRFVRPDRVDFTPDESVLWVALGLVLLVVWPATKAYLVLMEPPIAALGDTTIEVELTGLVGVPDHPLRPVEVKLLADRIECRTPNVPVRRRWSRRQMQKLVWGEDAGPQDALIWAIHLLSVAEVWPTSIRPDAGYPPWAVLPTGECLYPRPGDAIAIRSRDHPGDILLPVPDAGFASELVRRRIHRARVIQNQT
ncbi:hypothetical protein GV791_10700 [Nocardia cyriacigeorgica]|uniref:Uncharacterized protein n=1 Tax=Nocardia cyriacigeorgica TaxID=135487 RepID=A0A6P1CM92_9NOCA|nr:hypothetical protein [Nocardia cyriacigeorgica]MBF6083819.1 hypothetical protein [Nocardia cyriacigeorgica]NEW33022.1 hypothetical protein [Nocardia cyriacigeorgica]